MAERKRSGPPHQKGRPEITDLSVSQQADEAYRDGLDQGWRLGYAAGLDDGAAITHELYEQLAANDATSKSYVAVAA